MEALNLFKKLYNSGFTYHGPAIGLNTLSNIILRKHTNSNKTIRMRNNPLPIRLDNGPITYKLGLRNTVVAFGTSFFLSIESLLFSIMLVQAISSKKLIMRRYRGEDVICQFLSMWFIDTIIIFLTTLITNICGAVCILIIIISVVNLQTITF